MAEEPKRARSTTEMLFAASLEPCPGCGTREPAKLELRGSGTRWSLSGPCPSCGARRTFAWDTEGHPNEGTALLRQLGDARPSQIISAAQLAAELERLRPLALEPEGLRPSEWRASLAALERALTCAYELAKFDASRGDTEPLLALRARYTTDAPRIWALEEQPLPVIGAIDRESLMAHERWLRAGKTGPGRLEVAGVRARELRLAGVRFEAARLERVDFSRANLDAARMEGAELLDVTALEATFTSVDLRGATLRGGTFARAALALAVFDSATIAGTSFAGADLDRSTWAAATVTGANLDGAVFGNAWLDGARFRRCTFRNADFSRLTEGIRCTTRGAVFEDCDLRFTRWDDRDLSDATFIRCITEDRSMDPAIDMLKRLLAAFNAHDLDAIMELFADDCELYMPRGSEPFGTHYEGKAAVRAGLATRFAGIPDVHYSDDRHWIAGDLAVSSWLLTGTTKAGEAIRVRGVDLLELRAGKIVKKDSYWKIVEK